MTQITAEELRGKIQSLERAVAYLENNKLPDVGSRHDLELYKLALLGLQSGGDAERFQHIEDHFAFQHSLKMDGTSEYGVHHKSLGRHRTFRAAIDAHAAAISSQAEGVK